MPQGKELVYRTMRLRPFRTNPMREAGFEVPDNVSGVELAELWVGGELEAIVRPARGQVLFHPGNVPEKNIRVLLAVYEEIITTWKRRSPV